MYDVCHFVIFSFTWLCSIQFCFFNIHAAAIKWWLCTSMMIVWNTHSHSFIVLKKIKLVDLVSRSRPGIYLDFLVVKVSCHNWRLFLWHFLLNYMPCMCYLCVLNFEFFNRCFFPNVRVIANQRTMVEKTSHFSSNFVKQVFSKSV